MKTRARIPISSPKMSAAVQTALFKLGYSWVDSTGKEVNHLDMPLIFAEESRMCLSYSSSLSRDGDTYHTINIPEEVWKHE